MGRETPICARRAEGFAGACFHDAAILFECKASPGNFASARADPFARWVLQHQPDFRGRRDRTKWGHFACLVQFAGRETGAVLYYSRAGGRSEWSRLLA